MTEVELLTNFPDEVRSFTYRVAIKPEDYELALSPDVWPYRVGVRLYKNKRRQFENSWQQQSGQTGGIIHENRRNQQRQVFGNPRIHRPSQSDSVLSTRNRFDVPGFESDVFN